MRLPIQSRPIHRDGRDSRTPACFASRGWGVDPSGLQACARACVDSGQDMQHCADECGFSLWSGMPNAVLAGMFG